MTVQSRGGPRILITGATGFLGSRYAPHVQNSKPAMEVHALVRSLSHPEAQKLTAAGVSLHLLENHGQNLIEILRTTKPDAIVHLATCFLNDFKREDIATLIDANIRFGTELAYAAVHENVPAFLNFGTYYQHFEGAAYNPVSLYAATKQAFEDLLRYFAETSPLRVLNLKLYDTYGPNDPRGKLISLLKSRKPSDPPLQLSPGEQRLHLIHIDDALRAIDIALLRLIAASQAPGVTHAGLPRWESFQVTSADARTLKETVTLAESVFGHAIPIQWGAKPYRTREVMQPEMPVPSLPGFTAHISLREGLATL